MGQNSKESAPAQKKKGFWADLIEKLDKKMEQKAQKSCGCGDQPVGKKGSSCC